MFQDRSIAKVRAVALIIVNYLYCPFFAWCQDDVQKTRFFRYDLIQDQEFSSEAFDLGNVHPGQEVVVQLYFVNRTDRSVDFKPSTHLSSQVKIALKEMQFSPNTGKLISVSLVVPKKPQAVLHRFLLECSINQKSRLFFNFTSKIDDYASFEKEEFRFEARDCKEQESKYTFSIPILLSDNVGLKQLRSECGESLRFLKTKFIELNGSAVLQVSFDSKDLTEARVVGEIAIVRSSQNSAHANSTVRLTIDRKSDVDIYPSRIILRVSKKSPSIFEGEAIVKCHDATMDVSNLMLDCESNGGEVVECRIERMSAGTGRIYLLLKRTKESPKESNLELLFDASSGGKVRNVFASAYIAN